MEHREQGRSKWEQGDESGGIIMVQGRHDGGLEMVVVVMDMDKGRQTEVCQEEEDDPRVHHMYAERHNLQRWKELWQKQFWSVWAQDQRSAWLCVV